MPLITPNEVIGSIQVSKPYLITTIADPGYLTSASDIFLMVGCKFAYTPILSTTVEVIITANTANDTFGSGSISQIYYGTGIPPNKNSNLTGITGFPAGTIFRTGNGGTLIEHLTCQAIVPVTIGITYWFDLGSKALTSGNNTYSNVYMVVKEF